MQWKPPLLIVLGTSMLIALPQLGLHGPQGVQLTPVPIIPVQTDDGLDPVNLIFTGYAPSWWVASNIAGWSDSAYCSSSKTLNGQQYNYTLEEPDSTGVACIGPRDHVRIWDMGYSPTFGYWSIGSAHHEHTVCNPACHHVIDSWDRAETDVNSAFLGGQSTVSATNFTLRTPGNFQGVSDDGNATLIQLKAPLPRYPAIFNEEGLSNQTIWSVTINGTTISSQKPDIVVEEANGTYLFTVAPVSGFIEFPSSGTLNIDGQGVTENIRFRTPWTSTSVTISSNGQPVSITFTGNASIMGSTVQLSTRGNAALRFSATEKGASGILNVTLPRSIIPSNTFPQVYLDGVLESSMVRTDSSNYFLSLSVPYGTHSVDLEFAPATTPYTEYLIAGGIAASILAVLFLISKRRRGPKVTSVPMMEHQPL